MPPLSVWTAVRAPVYLGSSPLSLWSAGAGHQYPGRRFSKRPHPSRSVSLRVLKSGGKPPHSKVQPTTPFFQYYDLHKHSNGIQTRAQKARESKPTGRHAVHQAELPGNWHHVKLAKKLDRIARRQCRRLMVFMPPQHGKSELVSRRLPAYPWAAIRT